MSPDEEAHYNTLLEMYRKGYMTEAELRRDHEIGWAVCRSRCWQCDELVVTFLTSNETPMCPQHYLRYPRNWQLESLDV